MHSCTSCGKTRVRKIRFVSGHRFSDAASSFGIIRPFRVCVRTGSSLRDLGHSSHLFPALKRWAKLVRPSRAVLSNSSFHRIAKMPVLTHTL